MLEDADFALLIDSSNDLALGGRFLNWARFNLAVDNCEMTRSSQLKSSDWWLIANRLMLAFVVVIV